MRVDTLSYSFFMKPNIAAVYQAVLNEQLSYFKRQNSAVSCLKEGTTVHCQLRTKTQKIGVSSTMTVTKIETNHYFQMQTSSSTGGITQTYQFDEKDGRVLVTYSERNTFEKTRHQYGFMVVGFFYKYFFNRGVRQRMKYLENLAEMSN
ncbi:DUF3284 domain-containing protein [Candidatus Enterococcus clewellii]|uniref:DUF3284 domain-containing protein n=1 Tax=Candidatus Enterococcus clewellii TaxID=1834193 RepID=A0A242K6J6_9ENTE|nr:DUF3284 domain-containing protein [Enterococcus sp. 9E7_DIV0242]OTP15930.1 hypothetical protein A5888_002144 [Enterococcus sp. 9E7_DIV0242]